MSNNKKGFLILSDGTKYEGISFGYNGAQTQIGEMVFNTSVVGYQEGLTDPNYFGQIMVQTFPLIGNYGVNSGDFESEKCSLSGYVVREWCELPSNFRSEGNISDFLKKNKVIAVCGIDTRALTKKIRENGNLTGMISSEEFDDSKKDEWLLKIRNFKIENAVKDVSVEEIKILEENNSKYNIIMYDFGCKRSVLEAFLERKCKVTVVPYNFSAEEAALLSPDGIVLSGGPGNPEENMEIIENLKKLNNKNIPVFGIGLGHQILALANGAKTEKLKCGHRGENQPVMKYENGRAVGRVYVTSQNHGYTVNSDSILPEIGEEVYKNVNDGTCEGIKYRDGRSFSVQFQPKINGGAMDTSFIYDNFIRMFKNS